jgi:XTP/dITP diphosphohydrolase
MRLVLASSNRGKLRELAALLAPLGLELIAQDSLAIAPAEESGATFLANALLKARHAAAASGLAALADDSGLEVDALGGAPGVRSARYAAGGDAANRSKLLAALAGVPPAQRSARFRCVLALVRSADDPTPLVAEGSWEGAIAAAERGANGFGYDPVFEVPGTGRTAAELAPAEKDARSHRGQALARLLAALRARPLA